MHPYNLPSTPILIVSFNLETRFKTGLCPIFSGEPFKLKLFNGHEVRTAWILSPSGESVSDKMNQKRTRLSSRLTQIQLVSVTNSVQDIRENIQSCVSWIL